MRTILLVMLTPALAGCPLLKKDAPEDAGVATPTTVAASSSPPPAASSAPAPAASSAQALTAQTQPVAAVKKCPTGQEALYVDTESGGIAAKCVQICKDNAECGPGRTCDGSGVYGREGLAAKVGASFCVPKAPPSTGTSTTTSTAASKIKCVLSSPPPCAPPHEKSPKGLCQLPCPTSDCIACDGNCQSGYCVPKSL